jgi:hypothetical protein
MVLTDIGIYYPEPDSTLFQYHIKNAIGPLSQQWSYYNNIQIFANSNHTRKVACFQIPYPYNESIEESINQLYDLVDAILIIGTELHIPTVSFIRRFDRPKMRWFLCGKLNPHLNSGKTYNYLDWFITSRHFYKNVKPSILYSLNPYEPKPYVFDALLGRKKLHRDRCYDFIKKRGLENKSITTYMNSYNTTFTTENSSNWLWEDTGLEGQERVNWTVDLVTYYNHRMSLSQVMPLKVYNQTAYSLVCETNCDQDYVFFTEKTVKPILARRLFILVANRYSLAMLQELGFKTFNNIINESYDEIEGIRDRQLAALEQLEWLSNQDQGKILSQCRDIVDHNFDVMCSRDWYADFTDPFRRALTED